MCIADRQDRWLTFINTVIDASLRATPLGIKPENT